MHTKKGTKETVKEEALLFSYVWKQNREKRARTLGNRRLSFTSFKEAYKQYCQEFLESSEPPQVVYEKMYGGVKEYISKKKLSTELNISYKIFIQ